jgi:hypothetical protein
VDEVIIHAPTRQSATKTTTVVVVQNDDDVEDGRRPSIFPPRPNAISAWRTCTRAPTFTRFISTNYCWTKNPQKNRTFVCFVLLQPRGT